MSQNLTLSAAVRTETGKAEMRRMRRLSGMVPAVVYGGKEEPQNIMLKENEVLKAFSMEGIRSHVIDLVIDGKSTPVLVKDSCPHPTKPKILHIDFFRLDLTKPVTMSIPVHFVGEDQAPGAKQGGVVSHLITEVELTGMAKNLPEFIEVDISAMEMGDKLHLSDVKLPSNVEFSQLIDDEHNPTVVAISKPQAEAPAEDDSAAAEEGDAAEGDA